MTRPLRIEFAGALYHITSRGDHKNAIFRDDSDRHEWMSILDLVCKRHNFVVHGFCQMTNHFHLIVETVEGNLAQGMRQLNSLYSQYFNRRHEVVGHVFQGRYKAILVQRESHLLELARYVVLNPLRGGIVTSLEAWPWSSYAFMAGTAAAPNWMDTTSTLQHFTSDHISAAEAYRRFVLEGIGRDSPLKKIQHQLLLGDDTFVAMARHAFPAAPFDAVAKPHRRAVSLSLEEYQRRYPDVCEAMAHAYRSTAYTMAQIATHFGVSPKTVSRAVKRQETMSSCPIAGTDPGG